MNGLTYKRTLRDQEEMKRRIVHPLSLSKLKHCISITTPNSCNEVQMYLQSQPKCPPTIYRVSNDDFPTYSFVYTMHPNAIHAARNAIHGP